MQEDPAKVTGHSNPGIFNPYHQPRNFQPWPSTSEFLATDFSTMNSSTSDSYGDEEFMVEKPEVEKCGFEMSILI